ncbi:SFC1, partial [Symbiodinium sp. KB8]
DDHQVKAFAKGPPVNAKVPAWVKMVAGMAGGVAEACALQPLDTAKTRLQLDSTGKYRGLLHCTRTIAAEEGVLALYKGLSPFVMHLTTKYAMRFGVFGYIKNAMGGSSGTERQQAARNFTAGLVAGVTEAILIVTPFEVIKTRLQKQKGLVASELKYKGPIHTVRLLIKEEGLGALWNGVVPTAIRQGSNQAFNFMMFILLQKHVFGKNDGDGQAQSLWVPFLNGLIASCFGPLANCPMDVVKTRLMAQSSAPGEVAKYNGWLHAMKVIYKEEGLAALWKGIGPRLARLAPGQAITWTVVTQVQTWYEQKYVAPPAAEWKAEEGSGR